MPGTEISRVLRCPVLVSGLLCTRVGIDIPHTMQCPVVPYLVLTYEARCDAVRYLHITRYELSGTDIARAMRCP
eukprot:3933837-Rhodomonas_salina.1